MEYVTRKEYENLLKIMNKLIKEQDKTNNKINGLSEIIKIMINLNEKKKELNQLRADRIAYIKKEINLLEVYPATVKGLDMIIDLLHDFFQIKELNNERN
jgi:hypothetical protein